MVLALLFVPCRGVRPACDDRHRHRKNRRFERRRPARRHGVAHESRGARDSSPRSPTASGFYRVANLPPATYDVKAELSGFQSVIRKATVRLNGVIDVDFTLSVGSVSETVTVTGEAPIVDPERAGLSVNISNKALTAGAGDDEPPLPGRVARGARRGDQPGDARADRLGAAHQHGRRRRDRSVRRRHLLGEPELRRGAGGRDQGARRRGRRRFEHGRPVHEHRDQERRQRPARVGGVLHDSAELQHQQRDRHRGEPAQGLPARHDAGRADHARQESGSSDRIVGCSAIRRSTTRRFPCSTAATCGS